MTTSPFWLEEAEASEPLPRRQLGGPPEVAVIGAGVTGCSCALTLAQHGVRVRVHEARQVAGGASGRNGGFALRGASLPYDVARRQLGAERARTLWTLTERALDRLEGLAGDAFCRVGSLRLAASPAERDALRSELDALRDDGLACEWLDPGALQPPLDRLYRGGILHPTDGSLRPARWVRRLARDAVEAGAEIVEGSRTTMDARSGEAVVIATDGFTATLLPDMRRAVRPTRGQVVVTEPLADVLYPRPHYARAGYDYWQQLDDGRLIVGGRRDASLAAEETDVEGITSVVQSELERLVAQLAGQRPAITHRWSGIWGTTADGLPLVGRLPGHDETWIAAGYSGHGNVLGLACGELVARSILGQEPAELELFDPARAL